MNRVFASAIWAALLFSAQAHANEVSGFRAFGILHTGSVVSGGLEIDTSAGLIVSSGLRFGAPDSTVQTIVKYQSNNLAGLGRYGAQLRNADATQDFIFTFETNSLVNFEGGRVAGGNLFNLLTHQPGAGTMSMTFVHDSDTIHTFLAAGHLQDGAVITGSITVDTTIGNIVSSDLTIGTPDTTTLTFATTQSANAWSSGLFGASLGDIQASNGLNIVFNVPTLVNYRGGTTLSGNLINRATNANLSNIADLTFTATVPEPASSVLWLCGMLGIGLLYRQRASI